MPVGEIEIQATRRSVQSQELSRSFAHQCRAFRASLDVQIPNVGEVTPDDIKTTGHVVGQVLREEGLQLDALPVGGLVVLLEGDLLRDLSRLLKGCRTEEVRIV